MTTPIDETMAFLMHHCVRFAKKGEKLILLDDSNTQTSELYLYKRGVSHIPDLSMVEGLVHLNLAGNPIQDISPLAKLTELLLLDIEDNTGVHIPVDILKKALPHCRVYA